MNVFHGFFSGSCWFFFFFLLFSVALEHSLILLPRLLLCLICIYLYITSWFVFICLRHRTSNIHSTRTPDDSSGRAIIRYWNIYMENTKNSQSLANIMCTYWTHRMNNEEHEEWMQSRYYKNVWVCVSLPTPCYIFLFFFFQLFIIVVQERIVCCVLQALLIYIVLNRTGQVCRYTSCTRDTLEDFASITRSVTRNIKKYILLQSPDTLFAKAWVAHFFLLSASLHADRCYCCCHTHTHTDRRLANTKRERQKKK